MVRQSGLVTERERRRQRRNISGIDKISLSVIKLSVKKNSRLKNTISKVGCRIKRRNFSFQSHLIPPFTVKSIYTLLAGTYIELCNLRWWKILDIRSLEEHSRVESEGVGRKTIARMESKRKKSLSSVQTKIN